MYIRCIGQVCWLWCVCWLFLFGMLKRMARYFMFHSVFFPFYRRFRLSSFCLFVHAKWEMNSDFCLCVLEIPFKCLYTIQNTWNHIIFRSRLKIGCPIQGKRQANFLWIWIGEFANRNVSHSPTKPKYKRRKNADWNALKNGQSCFSMFYLVAMGSTWWHPLQPSIVQHLALVFVSILQLDWS